MTVAYTLLACAILVRSNVLLDVVRPFHIREVQALITSFEKWVLYPPCDVSKVQMHGRTLTLWSSSFLSREDTEEVAQKIKNDNTWHECFTFVIFDSPDLTPEEDVYNDDQNSLTWNAGPNIQFYEYIARHKYAQRPFVLVEPDTYPTQFGWLELLEKETNARSPFAIMGTTYNGHKWDAIKNYIPLELLTHLNGNAIYNLSSPLLQITRENYDRGSFLYSGHNSYDVQFAKEVIFRQMQDQYIETPLIQNFAGSYVKSSEISPKAVLIHGLPNIEAWPVDTEPLSLLVSQIADKPLNETKFKDIGIYQTIRTNITEEALCTDAVDSIKTNWFLWVPSDVGPPPSEIETSLHHENSSQVVPLAEYTHHDSHFCGPPCREKIYTARKLFPSADRHYESNYIAYSKRLVKNACKKIKSLPEPLNNSILSPNTYMAYVHWTEGRKYCLDNNEPTMCSMQSVIKACNRDNAVGRLVRQNCFVTCADDVCRGYRNRRQERTSVYREFDVEQFGRLPGFQSSTKSFLNQTTLQCAQRDFVLDDKIMKAGSCLEHPTAENHMWCPTEYGLDDTGLFVPEVGNGSWIWCNGESSSYVKASLAHIALLNFTHGTKHNPLIIPIVVPIASVLLLGAIYFYCKHKKKEINVEQKSDSSGFFATESNNSNFVLLETFFVGSPEQTTITNNGMKF